MKAFDGWAASAGGFPAMVGNVAFLMKDVVLLAVSIYLLRQDALRVLHLSERTGRPNLQRDDALLDQRTTDQRTTR